MAGPHTRIGSLLKIDPAKGVAELEAALEKHQGEVVLTAQALGIERQHLWTLLRRHGLGTKAQEIRQRQRTMYRVPRELLEG